MRNHKIKYCKLRIFLRCNYHMNEQAPSKRRFSQISKQNKMNVVIFFASFGNMCTAQYINLYACKKTNCGKLIEDIHSFRWFFVLIWPLHNSFLFAFFYSSRDNRCCRIHNQLYFLRAHLCCIASVGMHIIYIYINEEHIENSYRNMRSFFIFYVVLSFQNLICHEWL